MAVEYGLLRTASGALDIAIRAPGGESLSQIALGRQVNSARQLIVGSTPATVINGIGLTSDGCVCITATEPATKRGYGGIVTDTSGRVWATESPVAPIRQIYDPLLEFVLIDGKGALYVDGLPTSAADILALTPVAWCRYGVGITSAGGLVSAWADQSGNARNLVQASGTNQPTLQADNSILFDGNDNQLEATFTLNQPCTFYCLVNQVSWTSNDRILDGSSNTCTIFQRGSTNTIGAGAGSNIGTIALALGTYGIAYSVFNGASSIVGVNTSTTSGDMGANNPGGVSVGGSGSITTCSNVAVKEAIIFASAHDAAQRASVINYLSFVGA